jgi:hypothetical protein
LCAALDVTLAQLLTDADGAVLAALGLPPAPEDLSRTLGPSRDVALDPVGDRSGS